MSTLLIGFDSAWTATKCGAIVGALSSSDGVVRALGPPQTADYNEAADVILKWQVALRPTSTIVLLDQPTIVGNASGQRPVENIVGSPVSSRYGGMQPANTNRKEMFGRDAPVWSFLEQFGGAADPLDALPVEVFATYPVLAMIALGWTLPDSRASGRLAKYNPERKKTFSLSDWRYVCGKLSDQFKERGLKEVFQWLETARRNPSPRKSDQDSVDSCFCLLVALYLVERRDCLMVGNRQTGYIIVPDSAELRTELEVRCSLTDRVPSEWVQAVRLSEMPVTSCALASAAQQAAGADR
jgi:predicted RNase H-like nuclease